MLIYRRPDPFNILDFLNSSESPVHTAISNDRLGWIVVLDGGRMIETGTHAELLAMGGIC